MQGRLVRDGETVGSVSIDGPEGATGQSLSTAGASEVINAPVSAVPTARLTAQFQAGSAAGEYVITLALDGGNAVEMFVSVKE